LICTDGIVDTRKLLASRRVDECLGGRRTATSFWTACRDLLALIVSLIALVVSILTTRQNLKATRQIAQDAAHHQQAMTRVATYQRIHELLVDPKASSGRRRLFQAARAKKYPALGEEGWDEINYSLALYDTLVGYVHRGQVDESVVLDAWHHPLANIADRFGRSWRTATTVRCANRGLTS
jgi:hypothetical protein